MKPPAAPWITRKKIRLSRLQAKPLISDMQPNSDTAMSMMRTCPKRPATQPVRGTVMACATVYEVTIHAPWLDEAPRKPVMAGSETFVIVLSSTCMKLMMASTQVRNAVEATTGACAEGAESAVAAAAVICALRPPDTVVLERAACLALPPLRAARLLLIRR